MILKYAAKTNLFDAGHETVSYVHFNNDKPDGNRVCRGLAALFRPTLVMQALLLPG